MTSPILRRLGLGILTVAPIASFAGGAGASLIGTELNIEVLFQQTETSDEIFIAVEDTATVREPGTEFPDLSTNQVSNPFGLFVVPVAVNAGDDFLEFDILRGSASFAPGFFNGYRFTFESAALVDITDAVINEELTTLGISPDDLTFTGNTLLLNVASLPYNPDSFARIDLTVLGGPEEPGPAPDQEPGPAPSPIPEPGTLALFGVGGLGLLIIRRHRKAA